MKNISISILFCSTLFANNSYAQVISMDKNNFEPVNVSMSMENITGKKAIRAIKDSNVQKADEPTYIKIKGTDFKNGTIEVKVLSRLLKNAPDYARGFIGVAFRINDSNTRFECIYLRPVNARVEDQVRRNHSIQYYSYPDYKFDRFRKESYTDMEMNKWITMRIEVKDMQAKLFLDNNQQPSLIVSDLKHGKESSGTIGLWVETGTEGFFSDIKIHRDE